MSLSLFLSLSLSLFNSILFNSINERPVDRAEADADATGGGGR